MSSPRNPVPTVDVIIELEGPRIVLVERMNPPHGWALPGGFVDYGEALWQAAAREALEETGLSVTLLEQFHAYSAPDRDPRQHTVTTVFTARAHGEPRGGDDARQAKPFPLGKWPELAFDHAAILDDYLTYRRGGPRPAFDR